MRRNSFPDNVIRFIIVGSGTTFGPHEPGCRETTGSPAGSNPRRRQAPTERGQFYMGIPKRKWASTPERLTCISCLAEKPIQAFNWSTSHKRVTCSSCKLKSYRDKLRGRVIEAYGGKCACCGELAREFLTIDHIGNWGHIDRDNAGVNKKTGTWLYREVERLKFPKDRYALLCYNCNCSIGHYGYCPHRPLLRCDPAPKASLARRGNG